MQNQSLSLKLDRAVSPPKQKFKISEKTIDHFGLDESDLKLLMDNSLVDHIDQNIKNA